MPSPFVKYRDFFEPETAAELMELLRANAIDFRIEEIGDQFGSMLGDMPLKKAITLKIKKEDFVRVDSLLAEDAIRDLNSVDKDHYLFSFSADELLDILNKPDEWSAFDYQLARKILKERGIAIDDQKLEGMKHARLKDLGAPEASPKVWIFAGYVLAFIGGLVGVFIGWHLYFYKKVLPNGDRVYGYSHRDRMHGLRIFILGAILFLISLGIRAYTDYYWFLYWGWF